VERKKGTWLGANKQVQMDKEARKQKVEEIREKMGAPRSRALESNHRTRDAGNRDGGGNTLPQPNTATDTNNQPPPSPRIRLGSTKKEEPEKDPTKKEV